MKLRTSIIKIIKHGGVGVLPTDTLYGLVGPARNPQTVERIYQLRQRPPSKPFIILINSLADLKIFGVKLTPVTYNLLTNLWPGPVSVVLPCPLKKFYYLHRGKNTLAFRLPKPRWLRSLLKQTGPLIAPSANLAGQPSAINLREAKKYFGKQIDFYWPGGQLTGPASKLLTLKNGAVKIIRT